MTNTTTYPAEWLEAIARANHRRITAGGMSWMPKAEQNRIAEDDWQRRPNGDRELFRREARAMLDALAGVGAFDAVQRVRDLCARALADPGEADGGEWEDPTPIPGWVTAVENALNGQVRP